MTHISVDLETLDTVATAAIISIGACTMLQGGQREEFYVQVNAISCDTLGLTASPDTINWWLKQGDKAQEVFSGGVDVFYALRMFNEWLMQFHDVKMWGNGASFDNAILAHAMSKAGIDPAWRYWNDRCYRTVTAPYYKSEGLAPNNGTKHNALDDAIAQAAHLEFLVGKYALRL